MQNNNSSVRFVICCILFSFCLLAYAGKPKTSKIVFTETNKEIGVVDRSVNPTKTFFFEFKNKGKSDLILKSVLPDCDCTKVEFNKEPIKKGKKGFIKVTFNSSEFGVSGTKIKSIFVKTNSLITPEVELRFSANVK